MNRLVLALLAVCFENIPQWLGDNTEAVTKTAISDMKPLKGSYQAEKWRRSFKVEETAQAIQGLGRSVVCIKGWGGGETWQVVMSGS